MLAGRSNVGKSTLLNALIGSKVAIVSPKPQTTRHPVRGILHDARGQIVFVDTPGVFLGRKDKLSRKLNEFVEDTLEGVDAVVYVVDPTREFGPEEERIQNMLRLSRLPKLLVINKSDLSDKEKKFLPVYAATDIGQMETVEASAKSHKNLNRIVDILFGVLQENEPHYPELQLTDLGHNQWLEELVREKIFLNLEEEIPYSIRVSLEELEVRHDGSRFIKVNIWTTQDRYKAMIIGRGGQMLKQIGSAARKELEEVTQNKIFLELSVKVDPKWQERFG